jgi:hypothetical protein
MRRRRRRIRDELSGFGSKAVAESLVNGFSKRRLNFKQ